jgi:hypothetical protein
LPYFTDNRSDKVFLRNYAAKLLQSSAHLRQASAHFLQHAILACFSHSFAHASQASAHFFAAALIAASSPALQAFAQSRQAFAQVVHSFTQCSCPTSALQSVAQVSQSVAHCSQASAHFANFSLFILENLIIVSSVPLLPSSSVSLLPDFYFFSIISIPHMRPEVLLSLQFRCRSIFFVCFSDHKGWHLNKLNSYMLFFINYIIHTFFIVAFLAFFIPYYFASKCLKVFIIAI